MKSIFKTLFLFIIIYSIFSIPSFVHAWNFGDPVVPCGRTGTAPCTRCDIFVLIRNLIDIVLKALMPAIATLMFVIGGFFILIGGTNPGYVARGKSIFWGTFIGVIIILCSWLIVNTILVSLASQGTNILPWTTIECTATIPTYQTPTYQTPGYQTPGYQTPGYQTPGYQTPGYQTPGYQTPTGGVSCPMSGVNLCQGKATTCGASACSQYVTAINQYIGGAATVNLLKAIMYKESSCNIASVSPDGQSFGLMQLKPATANIYRNQCGVNQVIDGAWLTDPTNAGLSICIAAEYIRSLEVGSCGPSFRNVIAGYNGGGTGACSASVDCAAETSCDGGFVRRWECLYDDPQHTVCNIGTTSYEETRNYVIEILYCRDNPGF